MNHKWKILLNDNPIFLETWLSMLTHLSKVFRVHIWPVAAQITISCNKWKSVTIFIFLISKIAYNSDRSADTLGIVLQNLRQEAFLSFLQSLMGANFFKGDRIIPDVSKTPSSPPSVLYSNSTQF